MARSVKLFLALIFFSVFALGFTSCSDDEYSLGKYWENIVTVNKIGDNTYDFTLDNGKKLWVAAPVGLNLNPKYERAIINYTILSDEMDGYDHYIKLNGIYDVLTKAPVYVAEDDEVKQDSIGYDPIRVHSIWEGGGYLNIYFGYNAGGSEAHMLNLVSDQSDLGVDDDIVKLEFRHNKRNDPERYAVNGYVSFNLDSYAQEGRNKVTFEILWTDFGGEAKSKTIEYEYNEAVAQSDNTIATTIENMTNLNIY